MSESCPDTCVFSDIDLSGLDHKTLALSSPLACQIGCAADAGCYSFMFNTFNNLCYLKTYGIAAKSISTGYVTGPKKCVSTIGTSKLNVSFVGTLEL